jgi:hypothetical protein
MMKFQQNMRGSSPAAGSTKRASTEALDESPAAKRAKRVKHDKKRRSKAGQNLDGFVAEDDWVFSNGSPATGSPMGRRETPIKSITPFPLKSAHKMHGLKSAEKLKAETESETKKEELKANDLNQNAKYPEHGSPKTAANTAKTRAERESKSNPKHQVKKNGLKATPTVEPTKADTKKESLTELATFTTSKSPRSSAPASSPPLDSAISHLPNGTNNSTEISSAPTGTRTLKSINKHLKSLEAKLSTTTTNPCSPPTTEISTLRNDITALYQRLDRAELRAAIRHEMLFNALIKVSTDVGRVSDQLVQMQQQQQQQEGQVQNEDGSTATTTTDETASAIVTAASAAAKDKHSASLKQSRKTLEQCLRIHTENMNRAGSGEEVVKFGGLCVQYAGDLFKTLG